MNFINQCIIMGSLVKGSLDEFANGRKDVCPFTLPGELNTGVEYILKLNYDGDTITVYERAKFVAALSGLFSGAIEDVKEAQE